MRWPWKRSSDKESREHECYKRIKLETGDGQTVAAVNDPL